MNLVFLDLVVVVFIILGALIGLKKGLVKEVVSIVGIILVVIIAWSLKNILSEFLYTTLPFFSFKGELALLNIIIFELVSFLIIAIILLIILKLIVTVTGILDKIIGIASGLGTISKLLGLVVGFLESYIIVFFVLFFLSGFARLSVDNTLVSKYILNDSPIISSLVKKENESLKEITALKDKYQEKDEKYNEELFEILIKYEVINKDTARKLVKDNKININNAEEIINKYN